MMRYRARAFVGALVLSGACSFNSSSDSLGGSQADSDSDATEGGEASGSTSGGQSGTSGSASASGSTGGGPTTAPTTDPTTAPTSASTTGSTATSGLTGDASATTSGASASTSGADPSGPGTTGAPDLCDPPPAFTELLWSVDAEVTPPMETAVSQSLPDATVYAISQVAEEGTITFHVEVPCADEYKVWGLVFDAVSGASPANADSYFFQVDEGVEQVWAYGCQYYDNFEGWSWQDLRSYIGQPCEITPWSIDLSAGPHGIRFRNREASDNGNAAIAGVIVTNEPDLNPDSLFDPTP